MDKLRMRFSKTGRAAYISHLDLMRVMQRAFTRAEIPLKFSEGFNPHAVLSIVLPLSVGMTSECELMDFRLTEEVDIKTLPEKLNLALPEGIRASEVWEATRKVAELKFLRVQGLFEYDPPREAPESATLEEFFSRESLVILRRTKRGEAEFDLAPHVSDFHAQRQGGMIAVETVISAQEPTVNPEFLMTALRTHAPELAPDFAKFTRVETFDGDINAFR